MFKWFKRKRLWVQMSIILLISIGIPACIVGYNSLIPAKIDRDVKDMQGERLKSLLDYIEQVGIENTIEPLTKALKGIRVGVYSVSDGKNVSYGTLNFFKDNKSSNFLFPGDLSNLREESMAKDLDKDLVSVKNTGNSLISTHEYRNMEIIRYTKPILNNGKVTFILWDDMLLPHEIRNSKTAIRYIYFITLFTLLIGLLLMILLVQNTNSNIGKIRRGLKVMTNDLNFKFKDVDGEMGDIADSINVMAESLSKKKDLEEQLSRADKLSSLGQMVSGVAHEIRNPLGIIRGTVQLMERDYGEDKNLKEYIDIVKEQSDRESKVIQELLDYARPSKNIMLQIDINNLLENVLYFTNKYIQDKKVKLMKNLKPDLPMLIIDCDKIKQVFVNIIINACEAMENGGTLSIDTKMETDFVKIVFEDTGIGMDENQLKNIFNPYYTTKPKGTGLGLAISNGIIQMHGGFIDVKSTLGKGSTFVISLPYKATTADLDKAESLNKVGKNAKAAIDTLNAHEEKGDNNE